MKIILLGPPGAGKGTQALMLAKHLNIPQIATGDILRQNIVDKTALGIKAKEYMNEGKLVPDNIIINLIQEYLNSDKCQKGYILDGFPRTIAQAKALTEMHIGIDYVLSLIVDDDLIIKRLSNRRVHIPSGRVYHLQHNPPKKSGLDDITGEKLIHREDDKAETIIDRLNVYHQQTKPLIEYYKDQKINFSSVNGAGDIKTVHQKIINCTK
jgi:adenylate kinase